MQPPQVDNTSPTGDNEPKNVNTNDNDDIVVRLDELTPLNDPNCKHQMEQDDDELGDTRAWKCVKCHRGVFLPKSVTRIT